MSSAALRDDILAARLFDLAHLTSLLVFDAVERLSDNEDPPDYDVRNNAQYGTLQKFRSLWNSKLDNLESRLAFDQYLRLVVPSERE